MKKLVAFLIPFCLLQGLLAQEQAAVYMHYHLSPILVNPSVAGFSGNHQIQMNIRSQWTTFPNAPKTYSLNYDGPLGRVLGIGVGLLSEDIGGMNRLRFQLNYAFRYEVTKEVKLGLGFSTEFQNIKVSDSVRDNVFYEEGDEILEQAIEGNNVFDAALGAWARFNDATYIGIAFPNLIVAKIGDIASKDPEGSFFKFVIFNMGHEFDITSANFKLEPSLIFRKIWNTPFMVDFNLKGAFLDEKLIAGLSYRAGVGGAVGLLLGTKYDAFRFYYTYDVFFGDFQQFNGGSHEVTVAFQFDSGKKRFDRD
ncbi:MAG: type IX secretion system membrane protein PorP/SprF [Bacteroidetes bacterium]|nr:MAG: type IX secretion system membrane protein PorP/SprF [Bacteroidota bacterium]